MSMSHEISITTADGPCGVEIYPALEAPPDAEGVVLSCRVVVPKWTSALYYAALQKYDLAGSEKEIFPDGWNRGQPLCIESFENLKRGGQFLLLKLTDGGCMALLPLTGPQTMAWFESRPEGGLTLQVGTFGTGLVQTDAPLLAWAVADTAAEASNAVWAAAIAHPLLEGCTRLRSKKQYPEILTYLGWCSWEQYKHEISEEVLCRAFEALKVIDVPVRFALIDDGHFIDKDKLGQLSSMTPDPTKFPGGWDPVLACRDEATLCWIGLWMNFNGYWDGIHPENDFGPELNEQLMAVQHSRTDGKVIPRLLPKQGALHSRAFYNMYIGSAQAVGFDFVKIDNQAGNMAHYKGQVENAVACVAENAQALEESSSYAMDGLINCMAHGPVNVFNTRRSAVTRCSQDYMCGSVPESRRHLYNSYANMFWLGPTVWGDHDMFHSCDHESGEVMAASKALSGGPVYLSDDPAELKPTSILPLCFKDGRLLRPLAPAAPLSDSVFIDPYEQKVPFRVVAPLPNRCAVVAAYNLTEPECSVTAVVKPGDYAEAGLMRQPTEHWEMPIEGLIVYDWRRRWARRLHESFSFQMLAFGDALFILSPIEAGWAVIGRCDKYLAPCAVEVLQSTEAELLLRMIESGPLSIWSERGTPELTGWVVEPGGENLFVLTPPENGSDVILRITR